MKKFLSVLLIFCCISVLFTGCGGNENATNENGKITISWMGYPNGSLVEGGYTEKLIEERFGVEIKPVILDSSAYEQKKPLLLATEDAPDIIYELDPVDVQNDAKQGFLMELSYDELKKNVPSIVKRLNETEERVWLYSHFDGKNYGIPNLYYPGAFAQVGQWRMDWLNNVGIEKVPSTIDEYHDALYKIRHNDPDGNGKQDTYGMTGDLKESHFTFPEIFGAYGVLPFNWMEVDGKIVYGGATDGTKQALTTLAKWYEEGLIHPDFITDSTNSNIGTRFNNGEVGYIGVGAHSANTFDPNVENGRLWTIRQIDPNAVTACGINPTGPDGNSGSFAWGLGGHVIALGKHLEKQPEKLKKIYEILEVMCNDQEFSAKLVAGEEGVHYNKNDAEKGGITYVAPYDVQKERSKEFGVATIEGSSFFNIIPITQETRDSFSENKQLEHVKTNIVTNKVLTDVFLKPDVVPQTDKYLGNLKMEQLQYFAKIIRGEIPVSEYDKFIEKWNNGDGATMTKNANETKALLDDILKQIK